MLVQNLICNGSHGISVGSLGQYVGEYDIVQNIYVYNISMNNASVGPLLPAPPFLTYSHFSGRRPHKSLAQYTFRRFRRPPRRRRLRARPEHNLRHLHRLQRRLRHRSRPMLRTIKLDPLPSIPIPSHDFRCGFQEFPRGDEYEVRAGDQYVCL